MILPSFVKKEFLLIRRDIHALLVLFVMPLLFILIMSFALKNSFSGEIDRKYQVAVFSEQVFDDFESLTFELINKKETPEEKVNTLLYNDNFDFILTINNVPNQIEIQAKSSISPQYVNSLKAEVALALQKRQLADLSKKMGLDEIPETQFTESYISKDGVIETITSVDQSVPSWLIFSMFFILIPISNTFMNERTFGTFDRLKSMNVSPWTILAGKFLPYLLVNQVQVLIMFAVGLFLMPLLGLDALNVRGGFYLVFLVALCTSFAAISFGLLIANIARTSEEATTLGGVSNIIFAAIGGIMVPKLVMPEAMQDISDLSPMSWALDSFLEVIITDGTFADIQWNLLRLLLFASGCLVGAAILLKRKGAVR